MPLPSRLSRLSVFRRRQGRRLALVTAVALGVGVFSAVTPPIAAAAPGASAGPRGAVLVDTDDATARGAVIAAGGQLFADYGAFGLWTVPAAARARIATVPGVTGDDRLTRIDLRNATLATDATVAPPGVLAAPASGARQLRLVQFVGPARAEWLARLSGVDARIVGFVPNNAYIVYVSAKGAAALDALVGSDPVIQYSGPFHPSYRLAPDLLTGVAKKNLAGRLDVVVQIVDGVDADATLAAVTAFGRVVAAPYTLAGLRTVAVDVAAKDLGAIASLGAVVDVERYALPTRNDEVQDQLLAGNVQEVGGKTVPTAPGYVAWLQEHGFPTTAASYPIVSVVDDGLDTGSATPTHPDFFGLGVTTNPDRVAAVTNCTADATARSQGGHGTLNAGIVGGYNNRTGTANEDAGAYQYGLGVSPYGRLAGVKIFTDAGPFDTSACGGGYPGIVAAAYAQGAAFATNSWGSASGGAYTASSQTYDAMVRDASSTTAGNQQMLQIFSSGNSGPGANTIGSPGSAKNVLTVGATENVREQGTLDGCEISAADNDSDLAVFSSRGPTDDQRTKPDVVAAGTHVEGPASQGTFFDGSGVCGNPSGDDHHPVGSSLYTWSSGTSHSTPAVAGGASLAYQYYGRAIAAGKTPSPAMLKALMVNQPRYLDGSATGGNLPSQTQGWGVPNLGALFDPDLDWLTLDQSTVLTASGQTSKTVGTIADPNRGTHITMTFTDAPGQTTGNAYVNDLDLLVTAGGKTYKGNAIVGQSSVEGGTGDARNTVESVLLPARISGPVSIQVVARTIAGDGVPGNASALDQDFALLGSNLTAATSGVAQAVTPAVVDSSDSLAVADPGEPVAVSVPVTNVGNKTLAAGTGTLTKISGAATITRGTTPYPTIAVGVSSAGLLRYAIRMSPTAACGTSSAFRHTYTSGGVTVTQDFSVVLGGPLRPSGTYTSKSATGLPQSIPDNNATGVTSTIALTNTAKLADLRVGVTINHTWDQDLTLTLTGPDGTQALLASGNGSSGDNYASTVFDDAAGTSIANGSAPFTGSYRPLSPLSAFDGKTIAGNWKLTVTDGAESDTGSLQAWSLSVDPLVPGPCAALRPYLEVLGVGPVAEGTLAGVKVTLLNRPASGNVTVRLQTANGTATAGDFTAANQLLTWTPSTAATQTVKIPITNDATTEPIESFTVNAVSPSVPVAPTAVKVLIAASD